MKLLLDTTYLLPAIGISVRDVPRDALFELLGAGHEIYISEITIFELSAKGARYIVDGRLDAERASRGVRSIVYDERIEKVSTYGTPVLRMAFRLRRLLSDFIDCIIASSAINTCDILVTEDKDIQGLTDEGSFREILRAVNPEFKIHSVKKVLKC